jgi:VWA domain-containing protein
MPEVELILNRSRTRERRCVAALLVLAAVMAGCSPRPDDNNTVPSSTPVADEKYVPAGDEGLGASVAILIDNSESMARTAGDDARPKFATARSALEAMIASTDSFVARQPGFPINVGLYQFDSGVEPLVPMKPYDRAQLHAALEAMPAPSGGTAIGLAMDAARKDLYKAGTIRKYILVVTDGENTEGPSPREVAREIARRSEGAVRLYFVAFDMDAREFDFLREVHGEVVGASDGVALRASLDTIYRGKILAEAMDAGETLPSKSPRKRKP